MLLNLKILIISINKHLKGYSKVILLSKKFFPYIKRGQSKNLISILIISILSGYSFQKTIAANNETNITVGLTCE